MKKKYTPPKAEISELMPESAITVSGVNNLTSAGSKTFGKEYDLNWLEKN